MFKRPFALLTASLLLGVLVPLFSACSAGGATDGSPGEGEDTGDDSQPPPGDEGSGEPDDDSDDDGSDDGPDDTDGGDDGTEDGSDEPGDSVPATLIPLAFGGLVADGAAGPGHAQLANARLGTSAVDPGGEVTGQRYRMHAWLPATGNGSVAIAAVVKDGFGEPVQGPVELELRVRGFDGPALVATNEVFSRTVTASVEHGHLRAVLPQALVSTLADKPELWLTFALDGDELSPSVRMSPVARTVVADRFEAGGVRVEDGVRLPVEARESTATVVAGLYHPGELVEGLPDPELWTCTHRAIVLGYPRTSGHPVVMEQCKPGLPQVSLWEGKQTVAVATVGAMDFTTVLATDEWQHMIYAPCEDDGVGGCLPRVTVRLFEQSLSYQCEPYQLQDAPRPTHSWADGAWLDETTDPGAANIQVHVVSTCTYELSWSADFGENDP